MDYGHKWTDAELKKLEKRISAEYKKAAKEVQKKLEDYMRRFSVKFKIKQEAVKRGEMTAEEYNKWRYGQIMIAKRWAEMQQNLAEDFHNTNKITASMTRGFTYDAYAMNFNYGTFEAEMGSGVNTAFTLYDRSTVERLVRDDPDMLPPPGKRVSERIAEGKDVLWNKQQIQSVMTQSILQGESIPTIAKRLAETVGDSNMKAAIRNARTMTTGAENAGRIDSYIRAENMGIDMKQMWIATLDNRTRHEHRQLDGQKVKVNTPFKIDGYTIRFPGDPTAAPEMVYNCRCTLIGIVAGSELDKAESAGEFERRNKLNGKSYEEWKNEHATTPAEPEKEIPKTAEKPAEKSTQQSVEIVPKQQTVVNPEYTETPIKPKFTPAKTLEEAEEFISQYVDKNQFGAIGVSYKGINLDVANIINETLADLMETFDVSKIGGIMAPAANTREGKLIQGATAGYMPMRNSFLLNRKELKSIKAFEASLAEERATLRELLDHPEKYNFSRMSPAARKTIENSRQSGRTTVPDNIPEVIYHEFGHKLEKQMQKHPLWPQVRQDMQKYAQGISGYATTESSEYVAESFAAWYSGQDNIVDPNIITIFESLKRGA